MIELRLTDGTSLDLNPDEVIALNYAVNDIGSIETRQGVSSNEFGLPITDFNLKSLGYPTNFNVNQNISPFRKIGAEIYEDELRIAKGYIQITNPSLSGQNIPVVFFGENAEWFSLIKGNSIRELPLSQYNHEFNVTNVQGSFTNTDGYKYLLIDKNGNNFNQSNKIALQSWTLAVYQSSVVKEIFEEIGFKVTGTLLNDNLYKKTLIPDTNGKFRPSTSIDNENINLNLGAPNLVIDLGTAQTVIFEPSNVANVFGNSYNTTTGIYTAPITFYGTIFVQLFVLGVSVGTSDITIKLKVNGTDVDTNNFTVDQGVGGVEFLRFGNTLINGVSYGIINEGDTVEVTAIDNSGAAQITGGTIFIGASDVVIEGGLVNINASLPDIKQEDFIKEVVFDHNVLVTVNLATKTIKLDLKDYDYNNMIDWSNIIDLSKDVEINYTDLVSNYFQRNKFKRLLSDGAFINDYNNTNIINFGDYEFKINNSFIDSEGDIFQSIFAPTYQVNSFDLNLHVPYYPNEIISDTFQISSISAIATGEFRVNASDIDVTDFINEAQSTCYLLITDSSNAAYNGIWTITNISSTQIDCFGFTFTTTATGIGRLIRREEETDPRKLIDLGNYDLINLSDYSELLVNSFTNTSTSFASIPYAYFYNPIVGRSTDSSTLSLSYGNINIPSNNVPLTEAYYEDTIKILQNGKVLRASFKINQIDLFNLDFNKLVYLNVYLNGQTIQGYFIINKIEEYTGQDDTTSVELIKF